MQEHLCSHREGQFHFPTACTPSFILMTSLSSLPQLLAILDNLVEVSDLTDEERLWVYDKFASRTGKGSTRKCYLLRICTVYFIHLRYTYLDMANTKITP